MKNLLTLLLLLALATSCRTIQKLRTRADSTATRSEQKSEAYTREIITEYVPDGTAEIPLSQSRLDIGLDAAQVYTPLVHYVPGPEKIIRQTIRETGQKQESKAEQKTATVLQRSTEKDYSPLIEQAIFLFSLGLVLGGLFFLLLLWVLLRPKKPG